MMALFTTKEEAAAAIEKYWPYDAYRDRMTIVQVNDTWIVKFVTKDCFTFYLFDDGSLRS